MKPTVRQDFALGICLDNGLLTTSIASGEVIPPVEIMSLAASVQAIFISTVMESRSLGPIGDCHQLWSETAQLFGELCDSWTGVETNDPSITWLRNRLGHFRELALSRVELYSVSELERQQYVQLKADEDNLETAFSERGSD